MAKKSSGSKEPQTTKSSKFDELENDKAFPQFIEMMHLSNQLKSSVDELSLVQKREFLNKFWTWKQQGQPGLKMPDLEGAAKAAVQKVYRIKDLGKQFLFYVDEKGQKVGLEIKKIYGTKEIMDAEDPTKKITVDDTDNLMRTDKKYTIPYSDSKAEELMAIADQTTVSPTFYFIRGKRKIEVTEPVNFTGDFDELMKKANKLEVI